MVLFDVNQRENFLGELISWKFPLWRGKKTWRKRRREGERGGGIVFLWQVNFAGVWINLVICLHLNVIFLLRIFIRAPTFLRIINCCSIESILWNEMSQHLHVISCSFAKLRSRYALKKHWIERTMVLSTRSLVRHLRALELFITLNHRSAALGSSLPIFPRLNSENKQSARPAEHFLEQLNVSRASCTICETSNRDVPLFARYARLFREEMHFHLLVHAIPR